ncbi:MAG TPA: hypothetical protein O0X39_03630 [Methanocorpusculum sp.]|nr:hypothetical protein [Methanocorpusculum sp.]
MKKVLICAAVLMLCAALCSAGCAANSNIIFPYTNIALYNSELHAGDTLAMINNDGQTSITLSGSGGTVYFATTNFVPGLYSTSIAGKEASVIRISRPDAKINIQIYDVSGSELATSHGVSKNQGLVFKITPYISQLTPKSLLFETPDGGSSTFFGNVNSAVTAPNGLKLQPDGSYTFTVPNLRDAGVKSGSWDVRVVFDRNAPAFAGVPVQVPDEFLKSTSYNEQMSGSAYSSVPYTPDPVLIKTATPAPVKTQTPVKTPTPVPTAAPQKAESGQPVIVETPVQAQTGIPVETKAPASPLPVAGLVAGLLGAAFVLMRR